MPTSRHHRRQQRWLWPLVPAFSPEECAAPGPQQRCQRPLLLQRSVSCLYAGLSIEPLFILYHRYKICTLGAVRCADAIVTTGNVPWCRRVERSHWLGPPRECRPRAVESSSTSSLAREVGWAYWHHRLTCWQHYRRILLGQRDSGAWCASADGASSVGL